MSALERVDRQGQNNLALGHICKLYNKRSPAPLQGLTLPWGVGPTGNQKERCYGSKSGNTAPKSLAMIVVGVCLWLHSPLGIPTPGIA